MSREISDEKMEIFRALFKKLFFLERGDSLSEDKIKDRLSSPPNNLTESEILGGLDKFEEEGRIMISEAVVFLI